MFFLSITKKKIIDNLQCTNAKELRYDTFICTVVTDSFLSKLEVMQDGFSVVESPLISYAQYRQIVFSEVTYNHSEKLLEIYRSTISGRTIYYFFDSEGSFFCSTHISMLRKAGVPIEENTELLPEFFAYRYIIPPGTLYKNISQIPTGGRIRVMLNDENVKTRYLSHFDPPQERISKNSTRIDTISTRTLQILTETCRPLGPLNDKITLLLSGGLDSSVLFKVCQSLCNLEATTSTGYSFEGSEYNFEKEYALSAAQAFGAKHEYFEPSVKDYLFGFLHAIAACEQPLHHIQTVLLYLLFKNHLQSEKTLVICGEGADSLFGNDFHNSCFRMGNVRGVKLLSQSPIATVLKILSRITGRGRGFLYRLYRSPDCRASLDDVDNLLWVVGRYGDFDWIKSYFGVSSKDIVANRYQALKPFEGRSLFDMIAIISVLGEIDVTQDIWSKIGETNGKVLFYPYTYLDLLEHTFSVPWKVKLLAPKNILREVARLLSIPESIISRPKKGFGIHQKHWALRGSAFEPLVPLIARCYDEKQIRAVQCVHPQKSMIFWSMINHAVWKRLCIYEEPLKVLEDELSESLAKNPIRNKSTYKGSNYSPDARKQLLS